VTGVLIAMARTRVTVFAPATLANLGPGFDALGLAIDHPGDRVIAELAPRPGVAFTRRGPRAGLPARGSDNVACHVARVMLEELAPRLGVRLTLLKGMPVGSGLGGSAASSVAAVVAVNELLKRPLPRAQLLRFAIEGERKASGAPHADNVAPALLGGACLVRPGDPPDVVKLPAKDAFLWIVAHPRIVVKTATARRLLPRSVPLSLAVRQWANVGGLVAGLVTGSAGLMAHSIEDSIIEPVRARLIPCFYGVKEAALAAGALGCSIAGSGPSVFAVVRRGGPARRVANAMRETFRREARLRCDLYVSRLNRDGARVTGAARR
jgi:homoserine kinase